MSRHLVAVAVLTLLARPAQAADRTAAALQHCLALAEHASTGGQTACEATAQHDYDGRIKAAYTLLMRTLPTEARVRLQQAQRSWLAFRTAEAASRDALYATRRGTLYVPMQASSATQVIRDRALQLEAGARVLAIEP
ncbi:lysozyme inhibitor LprI family protein [Novosphingobium terrae]|uniref:lysozyme inhibitor LprI family protein n=1 Tax=Novosphingobium terrae TaxID=2726189 RepID=UPI00198006D2|nr:lysozyme inhibitor LprI family protein [Novosphingobium terrae]